jgi:hypothetical protein
MTNHDNCAIRFEQALTEHAGDAVRKRVYRQSIL